MDSWFKENIDYLTMFIVLSLVAIGITSIYSATYDAGASLYFQRQMIWAGAGFLLMISVMVIPYRTLQLLSYPAYALSLLMLLSVLILGKTIAGSKSWFGVQGFGLQPSEIVKVTTVLALASFLSRRQISLHRLKDVMITFGIVLLPVALILLQPDMGTAIIYLGMLLFVLYWAGASNFLILTLLSPAAAAIAALLGTTVFVIVVAATLGILFLLRENRFVSSIVFSLTVLVGVSVQFIFGKLAPYQQKRIFTFINPDA
ncbi:MAG: FtsW/RodA/SpoVE family cell cycle protein, partial [Ignavibacteriales bacterium]|nr:FtsW/RodA/SpoVE family cell cycle protein [Ignavibacteriales bacterium]